MKQPKYTVLLKGQERTDRLVNCLEVKIRVMEEQLNFMDEWHQRNNLLISGIENHPQEHTVTHSIPHTNPFITE
jgi:hypothetical protein